MRTTSCQKNGFWLWHTALTWRLQLTRNLEPLHLTAPQFFVLGALNALQASSSTPIAHGTIAQYAGLDLMMTSRILQKLENAHLLKRSSDPNDKRKQLFGVTDIGHELADKASAIAIQTDEAFFKNSPPELVTILKNLHPIKGL
jgi:DNA-binding MarR family transcriptional regulator